MSLSYKLAAAVVLGFFLAADSSAQEVFKEINSQRLEGILNNMNIQFVKGGDNKGTNWYDYTSNNQRLRLTNYSGKDLMVDIFFPSVSWEAINRWNGNAKFSRARLHKDNTGKESAVVEFNLDLMGGVTEETIKHFVRSFDQEVSAWLKESHTAAAKDKDKDKDNLPKTNIIDEETFKNFSTDRIEKLLNNMNITFKKEQRKGSNVYFYDFKRNNFDIRLSTFGGDDLMIDCVFPEVPLNKINDWNIKRNYIRTVLYPGGGKPYVSLEANLDCQAGVSENMVRYFITTFDDEARLFDNYVKGKE